MNPKSPQPAPPSQTDDTAETIHPNDSDPVLLPSTPDQATLVSRVRVAGPGTTDLSIGGYVVVRKIGEGGMGSVFLAEETRLGRKVAIKTMKRELAADKANRDRFDREARAAAAVEHENIVPIWAVGEAADGSPYIVMPFLQGEMLDSRLKREPVSPLWLILAVGRDTAEGLAAAHAKGLIHRDIKPGNVWLEGDPAATESAKKVRRAKVLDFGLARSVEGDDTHLTATGVILGTPAFMAPEQARGETVDRRADLFSLGAMLYRMATGKLPFNGPTAMSVLIALATETPAPLCTVNPEIPPALGALVDQLLQKEPAARPQTADEVATRLRQLAGSVDLDGVAARLREIAGTIDLAGRSAPVFAQPSAKSEPWAEAMADEAEPEGRQVIRVAEPLPEVGETKPVPNSPARAEHRPPAPKAARAASFPPPRKIPLPVALLFLLLVLAAGVAVFRYDVLGLWGRPTDRPAEKEAPPKQQIKFQKP